jgi:hypothetical protein
MSILGFGRTAQQVGGAVAQVAEVFTVNATKAEEAAAARYQAAMQQAGAEFDGVGTTWFDRFVNGLNRLPRPLLALSTIGYLLMQWLSRLVFPCECKALPLCPSRCGGCLAPWCHSISGRANFTISAPMHHACPPCRNLKTRPTPPPRWIITRRWKIGATKHRASHPRRRATPKTRI